MTASLRPITIVTVADAVEPLVAGYGYACDPDGYPVTEVRITDLQGEPRDATFSLTEHGFGGPYEYR